MQIISIQYKNIKNVQCSVNLSRTRFSYKYPHCSALPCLYFVVGTDFLDQCPEQRFFIIVILCWGWVYFSWTDCIWVGWSYVLLTRLLAKISKRTFTSKKLFYWIPTSRTYTHTKQGIIKWKENWRDRGWHRISRSEHLPVPVLQLYTVPQAYATVWCICKWTVIMVINLMASRNTNAQCKNTDYDKWLIFLGRQCLPLLHSDRGEGVSCRGRIWESALFSGKYSRQSNLKIRLNVNAKWKPFDVIIFHDELHFTRTIHRI